MYLETLIRGPYLSFLSIHLSIHTRWTKKVKLYHHYKSMMHYYKMMILFTPPPLFPLSSFIYIFVLFNKIKASPPLVFFDLGQGILECVGNMYSLFKEELSNSPDYIGLLTNPKTN